MLLFVQEHQPQVVYNSVRFGDSLNGRGGKVEGFPIKNIDKIWFNFMEPISTQSK